MFFLLRSAACIGVVFCMLPDSGGSTALHDLASDGGRLAVGQAQRYCTVNPDCLKVGARLAAMALNASPESMAPTRAEAVAAPSRPAGTATGGKSRLAPKG